MTLGIPFSTPYYSGTGLSTDVPGKYPIGLNGVGYFLDTAVYAELASRSTIPVLRTQADQSNVPGLSSLNPEDLWRRDVESWHHGAGQDNLDRTDSDPLRFRSSKGIDCWDQWQLALLPDTFAARASAATNLLLAPAGTRLYLTDNTTVLFTTDITVPVPVFTTVTGTGAAAPSSIVSDGFKVFTAHGANGVYVTNTGVTAATQLVTTAIASDAVLGYVKGRLLVGTANVLYNVIDLAGPAALPAALLTHPNTGWKWVGFAEGPTALYAAGFAGDKSAIYRTSVKPDGTALDVPIVAGELPDGEIVRSIQGYLGYLLIGTDRGLRLAAIGSDGNLQIGGLITTSSPVRCFEPQDRFVWYGLTNIDAVSTGLGRADLSVFTTPLVPAYATDLMVTGQGAVLSVATFQNIRVLGVSGLGFYAQSTQKVSSGTLDTGVLSYGIVDDKIALFVDARTSSLPTGSSVSVALSADGSAFSSLGSSSTTGLVSTFNAQQRRGERFELRLTLTRDTTMLLSPELTRLTFRSYPSVIRGEQFLVPILLADTYSFPDRGSQTYLESVAEARQALFTLANDPAVITYQEGTETWPVLVKDVEWRPSHEGKTGWNGTAVLRLLTVRE